MVKRKRERERERRGGFGSAFLPLFGFAFICSNRARKWIAGRWNEKQKRMNRRISENNTLCPRSTDYHYHPPSPFYQPSRNELHKYLATDGIRSMMQLEPLTEAKDTGCFLPNIAFVRFISSPSLPPPSLPSPLSPRIADIFIERKIVCRPASRRTRSFEEMNFSFFLFFLFFFDKSNIYARWGEDKNFNCSRRVVLSNNKRSVVVQFAEDVDGRGNAWKINTTRVNFEEKRRGWWNLR